MAGALHEVLQEQVVGALFGLPQAELRVIELQPHLLADVVVDACRRRFQGAVFNSGHEVLGWVEYPFGSAGP